MALRAGPADRLVRVHDHPLQPDRVAQRHQHRDQLHGGAVGVGDDAFVAFQVVGVDLRDDQRHRGVHPPRRRVVDHGGAALRGFRRERLGGVAARTEQGDVDAVERVGRRFADDMLRATDVDGSPYRARRGEEPQFSDRKTALLEHPDHRAADDAGGSDDRDGEGFRVHRRHGSAMDWVWSGTAGVYQRPLVEPVPPTCG